MATATALSIISGAMRVIGALASGEPITDANAANDALDTLNGMLDAWANDSMMLYANPEFVANLTPGQTQYTIGVGGQFNTPRPLSITSAFVRVSNIDYPITTLTFDEYELVGLKAMGGPWPRALYYLSSFPLGTIYFWPVASGGEVHLFYNLIFSQFTALSTPVSFPQGYLLAMRYTLAELLAPEYGLPVPEALGAIARTFRGMIKRTNMSPQAASRIDPTLLSISNDPSFILHGGFN